MLWITLWIKCVQIAGIVGMLWITPSSMLMSTTVLHQDLVY